jgi:threonine/homoserine/homoserine lactone efflux protein
MQSDRFAREILPILVHSGAAHSRRLMRKPFGGSLPAHLTLSLATAAALWYTRRHIAQRNVVDMRPIAVLHVVFAFGLSCHQLKELCMPNLTHLPLFILASAVLLLTPGPAVLYIIARSVDHSRRAGLVSVCGIEVGNFMHVIAATLGLSALLLTSALTFTIVKYLGAAYLIYLGLRKLFTRESIQATKNSQPQSLRRIFSQGVVVATLNPKTALFFVAFLPQFVDPSHGAIAGQMLVLGCIFVLLGVISDSTYALLAGTVGQWLKGFHSAVRAERYVVGSMYIGLGVTAALADARQH